MDRESSSIVDNFLEELSEGFKTEDIEHLKKTFKGLSIVLESKDDLKKAIEYLKDSKAIEEEKAAELQQAAEETRAFREKMDVAQTEINLALSSINRGITKLEEYQRDLYDPTLKTQKRLFEAGEDLRSGVFATSLSNHIVEGFGNDQNFKKIFGDTIGSQNIFKGVSSLMKGFGQAKELYGMLHSGSARDVVEGRGQIYKSQREVDDLKKKISVEREKLEKMKKENDPGAKGQEIYVKELFKDFGVSAKKLAEAMEKTSIATFRQKEGDEKFEKKYGKFGSDELKNVVKKGITTHLKNILGQIDVTLKDAGFTEELQSDVESIVTEEKSDMLSRTGGAIKNLSGKIFGKESFLRKRRHLRKKGKESPKERGDLILTPDGEEFATDPNDNIVAMKEGGPLQKMFGAGDPDYIKLEKTKTPNNYPQLLGALSLWVEEELKDKDDEGTAKVGADGVGSAGTGVGLGSAGVAGGIGAALTGFVAKFAKKVGGAVKSFASKIGGAIKGFGSKIGRFASKTGSSIAKLGSRIGPQLGKAARFLRFGALRVAGSAASLAEGAYRGWQIGTAIGEIWDTKEKQKEIAKQNELALKESSEYQSGDDKTKKSIYENVQKRHADNEKKLKDYAAERTKLRSAMKSASGSEKDELVKRLGDLESIEEELKKLQEHDRIFLQVRENSYKKLTAASKSEVEMKRNAGGSNSTTESVDRLAAKVDTLVNSLPEIVSNGTAVGINNA